MTEPRRKILIVDDDEWNLDLLEQVLGERFEVRRASSGEAALASLREFPAELVLLDVVMPGLDGYATCERILQAPETRRLKVILLSGNGGRAERLRGYAVGASDFLVKPFDPDELLAKVDVFLALKTAQDESRAKSDFVANLSHEIRTPMTAILGYSENLRDGNLTPAARQEAIDTIWRNGQHLLELVNNILDLSKIEAGCMTVEPGVCDPVEIVHEVVAMMRARAVGRGLALDAVLESPVPERIVSDRTRLKQILINLVGNGLKFTERGGVRIGVRFVDGEPGREPALEFVVADTGIGIDRATIETLGRPYVQGDASTTRRFGGSGLGLSISRQLARLLGGDLTIDSEPGRGSQFTVRIATGPLDGVPLVRSLDAGGARSAPVAETGAPRRQLAQRRILLAEDGADNQRLFRFVLQKAGAEVVVVENGREAVDCALAAAGSAQPFDVILMDMQMPVLDGYSATAELRDVGYTGPIIGVTAHTMAADRQRCLDMGCDRYAAKPVDREALIRTILEVVERR
ncbi:MAG: response regulator [Planctomycetes bacterium]|nr:response regulator [Planctomycetota bacterium]